MMAMAMPGSFGKNGRVLHHSVVDHQPRVLVVVLRKGVVSGLLAFRDCVASRLLMAITSSLLIQTQGLLRPDFSVSLLLLPTNDHNHCHNERQREQTTYVPKLARNDRTAH